MSQKIVLLDYGMCNLLNVARAFEYCGANVTITDNPSVVADAEKLVVPGVGAFRECVQEVERRGLGDAIRRYSESQRPLLGICVGMQMLFESSDEFGNSPGLGVLPGHVKAVPNVTLTGEAQRIPHIGWSHLVKTEMDRNWDGTLLDDFSMQTPAVYFVHSFSVFPEQDIVRLADTIYGGHRVCAAIQKDNLMATQFHPERSGPVGLTIAKRFVNL
jgi:glutamine amidotransferase